MRVVVDANIVAAALISPDGRTALHLARRGISVIVPATIEDEILGYLQEFADRAEVSRAVLTRRFTRFLTLCDVVPVSKLRTVLNNTRVRKARAVDPDDEAYVAAFVASGADFFWTRDKALIAAFPGVAVQELPVFP